MSKVQGCMTAFHAVPVTSVLVKLVQSPNTGKSILLEVICVSLSAREETSIAGIMCSLPL